MPPLWFWKGAELHMSKCYQWVISKVHNICLSWEQRAVNKFFRKLYFFTSIWYSLAHFFDLPFLLILYLLYILSSHFLPFSIIFPLFSNPSSFFPQNYVQDVPDKLTPPPKYYNCNPPPTEVAAFWGFPWCIWAALVLMLTLFQHPKTKKVLLDKLSCEKKWLMP